MSGGSHQKKQIFSQSDALPRSWIVTRHQYRISTLVSQTSFRGVTSGDDAKYRLFSRLQVNRTFRFFFVSMFSFSTLCGAGKCWKKKVPRDKRVIFKWLLYCKTLHILGDNTYDTSTFALPRPGNSFQNLLFNSHYNLMMEKRLVW